MISYIKYVNFTIGIDKHSFDTCQAIEQNKVEPTSNDKHEDYAYSQGDTTNHGKHQLV